MLTICSPSQRSSAASGRASAVTVTVLRVFTGVTATTTAGTGVMKMQRNVAPLVSSEYCENIVKKLKNCCLQPL